MPVIDFQTLILPESISEALPESARKWGKFWARPASRALHEMQPWVRFLPAIGRSIVEELSSFAPLTHALFESSIADLKDSAAANQVDQCVILSDPTRVPNTRLLDIAEHDSQFIPAIRVLATGERTATASADEINGAHARGARILQIHPASDGIEPNSEFYLTQLELAANQGWIVLIQTGSPKSHLIYRRPELSEIERFENWFKTWPTTTFVLARMGFNDPVRTIDLAETYSNLHLETSWQPVEIIAEAVRRIGAQRVLFGSDWPILGNNQRIGIRRVRDAVHSQMITEAESARILGENAADLLANAGKKP